MIEIVKPREWIEQIEHSLNFDYPGERNCGFSFPCDANGNVSAEVATKPNYAACLTGSVNGRTVNAPYVAEWDRSYMAPAEGKCVCGRIVYLSGFTCACDCGRDYNGSGQELAPRSQWGEETGESLSDILSADADYAEWRATGRDPGSDY